MIQIEDLHIAFSGRTVLDRISLSIASGEIVALVGANGSGKTSLFRAIAGAVKPVLGRILIDGKPQIVGEDPIPVSYVSDRRIVWETATPRSIMRRFAAIQDIPRKAAEARINAIVSELRMEDYVDKPQDRLSTGQAAKFSLARMLIDPYPNILLDEPTSGLDFNAAHLVRQKIRSLSKSGHTVFVSTHHVDEITHLAHRTIILRGGRIALDAPQEEMQSRRQELPSLIGEPA